MESKYNMSAYRESSECKDCKTREENLKKIHEFGSRCPMCDESQGNAICWPFVCSGNSQRILYSDAKLFGLIKEKINHVCKINSPPHFHYECGWCKHHWLTLTKMGLDI